MNILAIIPARGGSKRIPNKNYIYVAGQPLIVHSLLHALNSKKVNEVIVSTDSANIEKIVKPLGVTIIKRPKKLAADKATSESALLHVLEVRNKQGLKDPDLVVFLQCTSPVRDPKDIDNAINLLLKEKSDSLFSACENSRFIWKLKDNTASSINYDYKFRKREQDFEKQFRENGSIYVFKPNILRKYNNRLGGKISIYEMDYWSSFQIDTSEHLELIEWILGHKNKKNILFPTKIGLIIFDFDGVMTDNMVTTYKNGSEFVKCNRGDGLGIAKLNKAKVPMMVLSTETNEVVKKRCKKLKIECYNGIENKLAFLRKFLYSQKINPQNVIYVGNDTNDIDCLKFVGLPVVVADSHPDVIKIANFVLSKKGGHGAVRELCDMVLDHLNNNK